MSLLKTQSSDPSPLPVSSDEILETVREPLVVLGADLRVRRANRSFYRSFAVTPSETKGRLVYDLGNGQWNVPAAAYAPRRGAARAVGLEGFEVVHGFPSIGRKVMLLNARRVQGNGSHDPSILVAFEDITERRRLEDERREIETRFTTTPVIRLGSSRTRQPGLAGPTSRDSTSEGRSPSTVSACRNWRPNVTQHFRRHARRCISGGLSRCFRLPLSAMQCLRRFAQ